jgi:hypothetical protein
MPPLAPHGSVRLDSESPDDYNVVHKGQTIGRIYCVTGGARETWHWAQIDPRAPSHGTNSGVAASFDEAKAAFRAAWDAQTIEVKCIALDPTDAEQQPVQRCEDDYR